MNNLTFSDEAWDDYLYWQMNDKSVVRKINELLKDIQRNGISTGTGKPEPLKYRKAWSRRINHEHRVVYNIEENGNIFIFSLRGHYEDQKWDPIKWLKHLQVILKKYWDIHDKKLLIITNVIGSFSFHKLKMPPWHKVMADIIIISLGMST